MDAKNINWGLIGFLLCVAVFWAGVALLVRGLR